MATMEHLIKGNASITEQRLRHVTTRFVLILSQGGHEAGSIRRTVMQVATKVIAALASDEYQIETHTAIVQRTIEAMLCKLGITESTEAG
jgi:hypothetical protein